MQLTTEQERAVMSGAGRHGDALHRVRSIFPTLTNAAEEAHDYGRAYERLHAYCRLHNVY